MYLYTHAGESTTYMYSVDATINNSAERAEEFRLDKLMAPSQLLLLV